MRRVFWFGVGAATGVSTTVWLERKVRARIEALQPDHLVVTAQDRARSVGRSVVDAVAEGRGAMRDREHQLRRRFDPVAPASSPVRPTNWPTKSSRHHR